MIAARRKAKVLCVDDEPMVGQGLALQLGRRFEVHTVESGADALRLLAAETNWAVVISDMRMPKMDGATLLAETRTLRPEATRMLLTGYTDLETTIAAVNRGNIFRFLHKPCSPPDLVAAVDAAVEQHRLVTSERELLEQTLSGSVQALVDVIALASPLAFGRATRVRSRVAQLAERAKLEPRWQIEMAALMSQLGFITLPPEMLERMQAGESLSQTERQMLARVPEIAEQILAHIPRLEATRAMIVAAGRPYQPHTDAELERIAQAASLITLVLEFDALEAQGRPASLAVETLRGRDGQFAPGQLEILAAWCESLGAAEVKEIHIPQLRIGMVCAEEICTASGALLAPKGYTVTASFIERLKNQKPGTVREPLLMITSL